MFEEKLNLISRFNSGEMDNEKLFHFVDKLLEDDDLYYWMQGARKIWITLNDVANKN